MSMLVQREFGPNKHLNVVFFPTLEKIIIITIIIIIIIIIISIVITVEHA